MFRQQIVLRTVLVCNLVPTFSKLHQSQHWTNAEKGFSVLLLIRLDISHSSWVTRVVVAVFGKSREGKAHDMWAIKQYLQKKQWQVISWVSPLNINRIFRLRIVCIVIKTGYSSPPPMFPQKNTPFIATRNFWECINSDQTYWERVSKPGWLVGRV